MKPKQQPRLKPCHCWPDLKDPTRRCSNIGIHQMGRERVCEKCYKLLEKNDPGFVKEYGRRAKLPDKGKCKV